MALIDEITQLRDDSLASLDASHDYYTHTTHAWRFVQYMAHQGHGITFRNQFTGNTVNDQQLQGLAQKYVTGYLPSSTFQNFVSTLEKFVVDFLIAWLTEYPGSLSMHDLKFQTVLDSAGKDEIIAAVVQKKVYGLTYGRVSEWFQYLNTVAHLDCPSQDQIERLAEIKASRDVLVHNNGIANERYVDKSMGRHRFSDGDALELPESYHRDSWQLIKEIITDIADAGIGKAK